MPWIGGFDYKATTYAPKKQICICINFVSLSLSCVNFVSFRASISIFTVKSLRKSVLVRLFKSVFRGTHVKKYGLSSVKKSEVVRVRENGLSSGPRGSSSSFTRSRSFRR